MAFLRRVREATGKAALDGKLQAALAMLAKTPSGRVLADQVNSGRVRIDTGADNGPLYEDGTGTVSYPRDFLSDGEVWQQAVILAHELEHARQDALGMRGDGARGVRETAAFLVQCRVWVELGAQVRARDLPRNAMNSQDMLAWLDFPMSTVAAIALRADTPIRFATPGVRDYWDSVLREQGLWRKQWEPRFPARDGSAALFILDQAVAFRKSAAASAWMPPFLESAALERAQARPLPGPPTAGDCALLSAMGEIFPIVSPECGGDSRQNKYNGFAPR